MTIKNERIPNQITIGTEEEINNASLKNRAGRMRLTLEDDDITKHAITVELQDTSKRKLAMSHGLITHPNAISPGVITGPAEAIIGTSVTLTVDGAELWVPENNFPAPKYVWFMADGTVVWDSISISTLPDRPAGTTDIYICYAYDAFNNLSEAIVHTVDMLNDPSIPQGTPEITAPSSLLTYQHADIHITRPLDQAGNPIEIDVISNTNGYILKLDDDDTGSIYRLYTIKSNTIISNFVTVVVTYQTPDGSQAIVSETIALDINGAPDESSVNHTLPSSINLGSSTSFQVTDIVDPEGTIVLYDIENLPDGYTVTPSSNIALGTTVTLTVPNDTSHQGKSLSFTLKGYDVDGVASEVVTLSTLIGSVVDVDPAMIDLTYPSSVQVSDVFTISASGGSYTYEDGSAGVVSYHLHNLDGGVFITGGGSSDNVTLLSGNAVAVASQYEGELSFLLNVYVDGHETNYTKRLTIRVRDDNEIIDYFNVDVLPNEMSLPDNIFTTTIIATSDSANFYQPDYKYRITSAPTLLVPAIAVPLATPLQAKLKPWITHPGVNATTIDNNITVKWFNNGFTIDSYRVLVGTVPDAGDIFDSGNLANDVYSVDVTGVPNTGATYYITLLSTDVNGAIYNSSRTVSSDPSVAVEGTPPRIIFTVEVFKVSDPAIAVTTRKVISYVNGTLDPSEYGLELENIGTFRLDDDLILKSNQTVNIRLVKTGSSLTPIKATYENLNFLNDTDLTITWGSITNGLLEDEWVTLTIDAASTSEHHDVTGVLSNGYGELDITIGIENSVNSLLDYYAMLSGESRYIDIPTGVKVLNIVARGGTYANDTILPTLNTNPLVYPASGSEYIGKLVRETIILEGPGRYLLKPTIPTGGRFEYKLT